MLPGWLMNTLNTIIVQLYDLWPRSLAEWDRKTDKSNMNTCNAIVKIWMSSVFFLVLFIHSFIFLALVAFFRSHSPYLLSALKTSSTLLLLLSLHFCLGRVVSIDGLNQNQLLHLLYKFKHYYSTIRLVCLPLCVLCLFSEWILRNANRKFFIVMNEKRTTTNEWALIKDCNWMDCACILSRCYFLFGPLCLS